MHTVLAARSHFSIGESTLKVEDLITAAKAVGSSTVALTDTMSVTGMIEFTTKAKKAELKPIIGTRLVVLDDENLAWRKSKADKKGPPEYSLFWYVLSERGMTALFKLLSLANTEERYYFHPRLTFSDVYAALDTLTTDDVAIATGDAHSVVSHAKAPTIIDQLTRALAPSHVFMSLVPLNTPYWDALNERAITLNGGFDPPLPYLVTSPTYYGIDGADTTEVMNAISKNEKLSDPWHNSPHLRDLHPRDQKTLVADATAAAKRLGEQRGITGSGLAFKEGLFNTRRLSALVTYEWSKALPSLPKMAENEVATLIDECKKGWRERFGDQVFGHRPSLEDLETIYKPRLRFELDTLRRLDFAGYFLLVQDVVRFAKNAGILVGPGRGSVGGSLVAYLMGITDCDPLRFGLLFERFINPERIDLPDADLDFMSARRGEIIDYLIEKYGKAHVAGVSNFGTLAAASAIRDVAKSFGLPDHLYSCSKMTPKLHGANVPLEKSADLVPEIGKYRDSYPDIWKHSVAVEGVMRSLGRHAAGIIVGGCELTERAVVERRTDGATVNWDKRIVEDQGLVKMDILGLQTLDLIDLTLKFIRKRHSAKVDLLRIPLDDKAVLDNFAAGFTNGIFQFDGGGMKRLLKNLGKDGVMTFDDIAACTALYRPGPMESGMMDSYWKRKAGEETIEYDHPLLEEVLRETYGVFAYQEQVMKASQVIAGYSGAEADKLRKIMGKKLPEEMAKERGKFVAGCVKTVDVDEEWAGELFDKIEGFAGYGFNKSHSVEYSLISYQSMWLKTHYPVEFIAAALSLLDQKKLGSILKDATKLGIEVVMPDINWSTDTFEILTDTKLCIPLSAIKGVAKNAVTAILEVRKTGDFLGMEDLSSRVERRRCNIGVIKKLDLVGAFGRLEGLPSNHPDRIKDQRELIPGLVTDLVPIHRRMHLDKATITALDGVVNDMRIEQERDGAITLPGRGRAMRIMVIRDDAHKTEERAGKFALGEGFAWERICEALHNAGLRSNDCYWTGLLKRPKAGKMLQPSEVERYAPYLAKEIEILKPTCIIMLGSGVVRHFIKDFKGKASEEAGRVVYSSELDCNLILGFSPGEIYFDEEKQIPLNEIFETAAELTS